ncbi:hypothetical protein SARC_04054 [Sphaeroforma arctica JP610]|uniref:Thioredoxin domain-containing protein n=1 Tax=Sphaeroforma arctica JP610 TaxID=667725 RepID=A0A0L0G3S2_9EUKA|nr:hypothetical protein SARC_04054 [Sphaeroforma arctica JP610]KNC83695.1 hypothetical protein SARC_04054 [Sphaeroforma arctica JP610]|eukprot:XP_014157597.1 hypothetical protein SARC_04054 [Sphaeroforma arctica JP610]
MYSQFKKVYDAPDAIHDQYPTTRMDIQHAQRSSGNNHINTMRVQNQYHQYQNQNDTGDYSEFEKYLPSDLRGGKMVRMSDTEMQQYGVQSGATPMTAGDTRTNDGVSIKALDMASNVNTYSDPNPYANTHNTNYPNSSNSNLYPANNNNTIDYTTTNSSSVPTIQSKGPFLILETMDQVQAVLTSHKVVVVVYIMDGCGACAVFMPDLERLATRQMEQYGDTVKYALVNEKSTELTESVSAFPTTMIYLSGNQLRKYKGAGYAKKIGKVVADAVYV